MEDFTGGVREGATGSRSVYLPLHWEEHGSRGSPIVLIHGFGTNGHTWDRWLPALVEDHRVVLVEMKGFGASPKPLDDEYRLQDQAQLVHRLILQLDLRDVALVGHSIGGGVALLAAAHLLQETEPRLRRLILVAGTAVPQPVSRFIRLAGRPVLGPSLLRLLPSRWIVRKALRMAYFHPDAVKESRVEAYAEGLRTKGGRYAISATARSLPSPAPANLMVRLEELTVPTLLLWGDHDPVVPLWVGEKAARLLPEATLQVLPDCGHMPQEERPLESLLLARRFLDG